MGSQVSSSLSMMPTLTCCTWLARYGLCFASRSCGSYDISRGGERASLQQTVWGRSAVLGAGLS